MAAQQATSRDQRYAMVVLGMHRSGTSALAGVLARLGCDTPRDLLDARPMNEKGFYESGAISQMNDELMASAGSSWFTWQAFSDSWFRSPQAQSFKKQALRHMDTVYGDTAFPVLKDPRMCMLVPFWETVFDAAGYAPRYLHTHRHPLEVAQSLDHWAGYEQGYGQLLWLRYVLTAEAATRGQTRHFTSYNRLMDDWRAVARDAATGLDVVWPRQSDKTVAEIDDFLDSKLSHMRVREDTAGSRHRLTPWVAATFAIMERWSAGGEDNADWATLDEIRSAFDVASPTFSTAVETGRADALALRGKIQSEKQQTEAYGTLQTAHDAIVAERDALQIARDEIAAERKALQTAHLEAEIRFDSRIATLTEDLAQIKTARDVLAADLEKMQNERHNLLRDLRNRCLQDAQNVRDQLTTALRHNNTQADALVATAYKQQATAEHKLRAMTASTSWRLTAPLRRVVMTLRKITRRG